MNDNPLGTIVTFNGQPPPPDPLTAWLASLMACYNCRHIMVAGTQCPTCGSWCR